MEWDPAQYLKWGGERSRPFFDLLARVGAEQPALVVDLGCGPGNLTQTLADRWPGATVIGLDTSESMIDAAKPLERPGLSFGLGDVSLWQPSHPVDVIVSNAVLQWVPGHLDLLPALVAKLAPGGSHLMLFDLRNPLKQGDKVPITLEFEKAGKVKLSLDVQGIGAQAPAGAAPGGMDMKKPDGTKM